MPSTHGLFTCCFCPSLSPIPPPLCPCGHRICHRCHLLANEEQEECLDEYLQVSLVEPCLRRGLWICEKCEMFSMMSLRVCIRCGKERGETYQLATEEATMSWAVSAALVYLEQMVRIGRWRRRQRGEGGCGDGEEEDQEEKDQDEKNVHDEDEEDEDEYYHDGEDEE